MCEDGSHGQRCLMGNCNTVLGTSRFILQSFFIWGEDDSQHHRNSMKMGIKNQQAAEEREVNKGLLINP